MEVADLRESLPQSGQYETRSLANIRYLVVHHSGVDVDSTAESTAEYHINTLGWPAIGYHYLVHWDGVIEWVNDLETASYNVAKRNHEVLGILIPGNWNLRRPPMASIKSTGVLIKHLREVLKRQIPLAGHKEIALPGYGTLCPGILWYEWKPLLAQLSAPGTTNEGENYVLKEEDKLEVINALDVIWGWSEKAERSGIIHPQMPKELKDSVVAIKNILK